MILSLVYLQAIDSLSTGSSLLTLQSLLSFIHGHYLILAISLLAIYRVVMLRSYSVWFLLLSLCLIVAENFILLSGSFNKLTLVLNFAYLLFAFYFYVSWEIEVGQACFNPRFKNIDLEKESRFPMIADFSTKGSDTPALKVRITNIDDESCFLLLAPEASIELSSKKIYLLSTELEGVKFVHEARLVSLYDRGVGLVLVARERNRASWSDLYKVCLERAFVS